MYDFPSFPDGEDDFLFASTKFDQRPALQVERKAHNSGSMADLHSQEMPRFCTSSLNPQNIYNH